MTKLQIQLADACSKCGLKIELDFKFKLPSGEAIKTLAHISRQNDVKGMLIVSDYEVLRKYLKQLEDLEFGFSVLAEPRSNEEYSPSGYIEMFKDWFGEF